MKRPLLFLGLILLGAAPWDRAALAVTVPWDRPSVEKMELAAASCRQLADPFVFVRIYAAEAMEKIRAAPR